MAHITIRPGVSAMPAMQATSRTDGGRPGAAHSRRPPKWERRLLGCLIVTSVALLALALSGAARARADDVAYLIDVTVRPGYNFAGADAALTYGHQLCDKVSGGRSYADLIGDVKADFNTDDDFQASYLMDKAVNELCPAQIWALRNSAAHHRPAAR
jgi:Protein of unknown function (DUF732)